MDRLFSGLIAGAAVGALIVTVFTVVTGDLAFDVWRFAVTLIAIFFLLALTMPLTHAPLWFLLRSLRLPDHVASTLAGGMALLALAILIMVGGGDYFGYPPLAQIVATLVYWAAAGLIAGFVAWRVASFDVS